jgi:hypothetical protein
MMQTGLFVLVIIVGFLLLSFFIMLLFMTICTQWIRVDEARIIVTEPRDGGMDRAVAMVTIAADRVVSIRMDDRQSNQSA